MKVKFNISSKERKALVAAIAKITGKTSKYMGMPSMAYKIDYFTVDKNGILFFDDNVDIKGIETLLAQLAHSGFIAEEGTASLETKQESQGETLGLTVAVPRGYFKEYTLVNLENLIASKTSLIKKALNLETLPIDIDEEKVNFPWFEITPTDSEKVDAYTHFIYALCGMAENQKRVNAKEKEVDNEKYAFRCFLLRLGLIGPEYKRTRKILLKNLSGSSAFKNQKDTEVATDEVSK
ncbi:MAG: virulence protein [Niameybacter sp.]